MIHIEPCGCYQLEDDENNLIPFNQFSTLQRLVLVQCVNVSNGGILTVIIRLGVSSSLQDIFVLQYKMFNSQSMNDNNFVSDTRLHNA
jgi:hypothetical protein